MKYGCTLLAVRDLECSCAFYCGLLGMAVTADFGANVMLSDVLALQTMDSWREFLGKSPEEIVPGGNAGEVYFEEPDMDAFLEKLTAWPGIRYVHPPKKHAWGQRVVRFYDPDHNIVEVGEEMTAVVRRFLISGLSPEETARRMDVPLEYVCARTDEVKR